MYEEARLYAVGETTQQQQQRLPCTCVQVEEGGADVILWMAAWVNDPVHVQVEVVVLHTVRVRTDRVWWHLNSVHH
jgi:hypothetical protein